MRTVIARNKTTYYLMLINCDVIIIIVLKIIAFMLKRNRHSVLQSCLNYSSQKAKSQDSQAGVPKPGGDEEDISPQEFEYGLHLHPPQ